MGSMALGSNEPGMAADGANLGGKSATWLRESWRVRSGSLKSRGFGTVRAWVGGTSGHHLCDRQAGQNGGARQFQCPARHEQGRTVFGGVNTANNKATGIIACD